MPNKSTTNKSLSLSPKTLAAALQRIASLEKELGYKISFSGYIEKLIREDLGEAWEAAGDDLGSSGKQRRKLAG